MTKGIITAFIIVAVLTTGIGCSKEGKAKKVETKQETKIYKVTSTEVKTYIEATGSIQPDIEGASKILPHLAGIVNRVYVKVGDRVEKGQLLIAITSPDVTDTYSGYLSTLTQLKQAERIYNLNRQLFEIGAITKNELLNSESNLIQLKAIAEGQRKKLHIYGLSVEDEFIEKGQHRIDTVFIKSPMSGYIADIQTHVGDRVDVSTPLMTIADPGNIIVVANIYDTDIQRVRKGSKVTFYTDTFPDIPFQGVVTYVSDVSDIDLKTVKTFIKILDRKHLFKQNMFLQLKIEGEKKVYPVVPQSAVIYKEGRFYVYVVSREGRHEMKEIKPVKEMPGKLMAVQGISDGEEIVATAMDLEKT
ncbi:MAG: efflux RND transporter periplasmic adaptor subunit [Syntrophorhabdaceae bacterium]|nr:efflux RND transporter periplasmic adaptor subunit [Syntrophorhabdaceae bacterium]